MNEQFKKLRSELKLTQQQFADALRTSRNNVAGYEAGTRTPSDAAINNICREFNVNEHWLREGAGEMFTPMDRNTEIAKLTKMLLDEENDSFKNRLIGVLGNLTEKQWEMLSDIADGLAKKD